MKEINNNCNNCGECLKQCPENAISSGVIHKIDRDKCMDCMACVNVCNQNAIVEYVEPTEPEIEEFEI